MKNSLSAGIILSIILCWTSSAKSVVKEGELEVKLQFLEFELEDFCISKKEAEWKFLNGSTKDQKRLLDVESKESDFYKHELEIIQKHTGKKFSKKRLQRLIDIFSHPGAPLLGSIEFQEYRDYSVKLEELTKTMTIPCKQNVTTATTTKENLLSNSSDNVKNCSAVDRRKINKILYSEKSEKELKNTWIEWHKTLAEKNKKTKYDFVQQLAILDLEAEQNGEEELTEYWLKQMDTSWVDYERAETLWREILPLYETLKRLMTSLVVQNFGKNVLRSQKIIPAHVLGSLKTYEWITAAEKLGAFDASDVYKSIQTSLKQKKVEHWYKVADNLTAELKLGHLPQSFYEKSCFNVSSQTCQHKVMNSCERTNAARVMFCVNDVPNIRHYITINENVMRVKHQLLCGKEEEENGYLFREGPRESALYEAIEGLASLRALRPENLANGGLLANHTEQQKTMLSLLITALYVIPPLPYYLASDLWRINALREVDATVGENGETTTSPTFSSTLRNLKKRKVNQSNEEKINSKTHTDEEGLTQEAESTYNGVSKTYDTQNLTKDWWNYRQQYQSVGPPDEELYDDYLQDTNIIWNKPYLSKFLGRILQFQILENTQNLTADLVKLQTVMQKGKSEPWQSLIEETFNITDISVTPLLKYFEPLEKYLEKGMKLNNHSMFSFDDLNFVSQGFAFSPANNEGEGEKPAESSDALFFSLSVIAAVGVVAFIVTVGRRRYKRKLRARETKRILAEL